MPNEPTVWLLANCRRYSLFIRSVVNNGFAWTIMFDWLAAVVQRWPHYGFAAEDIVMKANQEVGAWTCVVLSRQILRSC
ncbi:MAG: hypothetical protein OXE94_08170 [Aestuariivita sp.]|nr:hypothetical protein [Aestuariivita sp.]MCY4202941.1 hypothetical protein [Aestuariivita sp.]MCY4287331.1 hypothetical protein [Aestuariivita sp.]MCY4346009.1 hypothetical protein [Aestuariivita sp.]